MQPTERDLERLRAAIEVARRASARGNRPFGALLVAEDGRVLGLGENTQVTDEHVLAHAEMNLLQRATRAHSAEALAGATLYTSAEPCPMCAGAIFWSGIGRLVFGLGADRLHTLTGRPNEMLRASARGVLASAGRRVEVVGPLLEDEASLLFGVSRQETPSGHRWQILTGAR